MPGMARRAAVVAAVRTPVGRYGGALAGVRPDDLAAHEVTVDGRYVQLTQQEFALLRFLCQNRGRVYSRRQLLERVWGVDYYGSSRTVDIHVRRLRMKLGNAIGSLETVRGVGYKVKAP